MFETIHGHTIYTPSLKDDSIIVDLGANHGHFSRDMKRRFGGQYFLAEANPVLVSIIRSQGGFLVWENAITSKAGTVSFNVSQNDIGSSMLTLPQQSIWNAVLDKTIEVQAITLDQLMNLTGNTRIDLLKMDIEGSEIEVIHSISKPLLDNIGQITVEFHSDPMFGFSLVEEVEKSMVYLQRNGFWCMDFSEGTRCNVLFINRKIYKMPWRMRIMWKLRTNRPSWISKLWLMIPGSWRSRLYTFLGKT